MTRLPTRLQVAWPLIKRLHRFASLVNGVVVRRTSRVFGPRALPRRGSVSSAATAASEPAAVTFRGADQGESIRRAPAIGDPAGHWVFAIKETFDVPSRYALEIEGGVVVGDYGANITPAGTLDYETSDYFGVSGWREHPIFLRRRLPPVEHVEGTLVSLATRGGSNNYYHFLLDVLPRFGVFQELMPGRSADAIYVPAVTRWQQQLLALTDFADVPRIETLKHRAVRADHLVVPCLPNPEEVAPPATIEWLRSRLVPHSTSDKPRRLYVTRGATPNTRRFVREAELMEQLSARGFERIDPGSMSVRDQIDYFAAAEVIVAPHGAALTNLVFAAPGVRVLELFVAEYVKHCYWAITSCIPDSTYTYLIGGDVSQHGPGDPMNKIQADIDIDPDVVVAAVDRLIAR